MHESILTTPPLQYDVREDEEQNVKLAECIDLLLAAGYFRARIKGLTPFDKVWKLRVYASGVLSPIHFV